MYEFYQQSVVTVEAGIMLWLLPFLCDIFFQYRVATNLEKSGNFKVVGGNTESQGKCVLAFGMPAITLFNDY